MSENYDCIVVGGGVIGMSIAWRTSQLGLSTLVCEAGSKPQGATRVAAGMLAPVTEASFGEDKLLNLNLKSASLYPQFLQELSEATAMDVTATVPGTLFVALDRDQSAALARLHVFQRSLGLPAEWLDASACRELEPALHPRTRAAILAPEDRAVDPRVLLEALVVAVEAAGGECRLGSKVTSIESGSDIGVTIEGGRHIGSASVVLAAGCWSGGIAGAPPEVYKALRPVKGQILRLRVPASEPRLLNHVVRTEEVYLVPRASREIVVGATVEEKGYDTSLTAGAVLDLLRAADEAVPGIRECELAEASAGLRPGTPDNGPLLGPTSLEGVMAATGHYRNGILLAPLTASAMASLIAKGEVSGELDVFGCDRFS